MKIKKHPIWKYGWVQMPLKVGCTAWYCEGSFWKKQKKFSKLSKMNWTMLFLRRHIIDIVLSTRKRKAVRCYLQHRRIV